MSTRQIAAEYRLAGWVQAFKDKNASGESITEFCAAKGISCNTYFYWQRKIRKAAEKQTSSDNIRTSGIQTTQALVPKGWAVCQSVASNTTGKALPVEIGKSRIMVDEQTDLDVFAKVCRVLVSLC